MSKPTRPGRIGEQTYPDVPEDEVGDMVQTYVDVGAKKVIVTRNGDGKTCTITVEQ